MTNDRSKQAFNRYLEISALASEIYVLYKQGKLTSRDLHEAYRLADVIHLSCGQARYRDWQDEEYLAWINRMADKAYVTLNEKINAVVSTTLFGMKL